MPIVIQKKGKEHIRDIKREACNYFYLTGGRVHEFKDCIRMALEDHVKMLQDQEAMFERQLERALPIQPPPTPVENVDPHSGFGG